MHIDHFGWHFEYYFSLQTWAEFLRLGVISSSHSSLVVAKSISLTTGIMQILSMLKLDLFRCQFLFIFLNCCTSLIFFFYFFLFLVETLCKEGVCYVFSTSLYSLNFSWLLLPFSIFLFSPSSSIFLVLFTVEHVTFILHQLGIHEVIGILCCLSLSMP